MDTDALKEAIRQELPHFLQTDPALRAYILDLTRREYARRDETQDQFYEILAELRRDREEQTRKYEKRHERTANRLIVISPMIDARARKVAEALGIETYGDSLDVETL